MNLPVSRTLSKTFSKNDKKLVSANFYLREQIPIWYPPLLILSADGSSRRLTGSFSRRRDRLDRNLRGFRNARVVSPAGSFFAAEFAGTAVLEGIAVLVVAAEREIGGEEAAEYGHNDADEDRVPRHVEDVAYVFAREIRHHDVVDVEQNVAARIAEDDRYKERHDRHAKTALQVNLLDFLWGSTYHYRLSFKN